MLATTSPSIVTYGSSVPNEGQNRQFEDGSGIPAGLEGPLWFHILVNFPVKQPLTGRDSYPGAQATDESLN